MISGTLVLEDTIINFVQNGTEDGNGVLDMNFTVTDTMSGKTENFIVPQHKFLKALAIAVHNDGEPDFKVDYPDAESIMGKIRWIP